MMSKYKNKSDLLINAAEDINNDINKCYFLVVPHSAYYSCFLFMKHLCYNVFAVKNENEIKNSVDSTHHGSHEIMITYVHNKMIQSCTSIEDKHKAMDFASKIGQLKKLRIKADYKAEDIDYPHSCKALELAKEVRSILKSFKYDSV